MFIIKKFKNWLNSYGQQSELESFISSRRPQNAADVDYLMRVWTHKNTGGWL